MSKPKRNHLDGYGVYWYGPPGHESHKKVGGLRVLASYPSKHLRKAKCETTPAAHQVIVQFGDDQQTFELFQRHPKTVWLHWVRDYRDLEALALDADNATIGEFSIKIVQELMQKVRENPNVITGFPFEIFEEAIDEFRSQDYAFKAKLGPKRKFFASPLVARFQFEGDCTETRMSMIIYLRKKELHRQIVSTTPPGRPDLTRYADSFELVNKQIKFFSMDVLRDPPVVSYFDLPHSVQEHLPSDEEIETEHKRLEQLERSPPKIEI